MDLNKLEEVRCGKVVVTHDSLIELGEQHPAVTLSRNDVVDVRLLRGSTAERPVLELLFGLGMIGVRLFAVARLLAGEGGLATAGGVAMAAWGAFILVRVVRPGHYLRVRLKNDLRKLCFGAGVNTRELSQFIEAVRREHGLEVASELAAAEEPRYR